MSWCYPKTLLVLHLVFLLTGCGLINAMSEPPEEDDHDAGHDPIFDDVGVDDTGGDDIGTDDTGVDDIGTDDDTSDDDIGTDDTGTDDVEVGPSTEIASVEISADPIVAEPGGTFELEATVDTDVALEDLSFAWDSVEAWSIVEADGPNAQVVAPMAPGRSATIVVTVSHDIDGGASAEGSVEISTRAINGPEIESMTATTEILRLGATTEVTVVATHPEDLDLSYQWTLPSDWSIEGDDDGPSILVRAPDKWDVEAEVLVAVRDEFDQLDAQSVTLRTEPLFCGGEGSESAPWEICSAMALNQVGYYPQFLTDHFELTAHIDLNELEEDFFIIGNSETPFSGIFDGSDFTISNLEILVDHDEAGLFGLIDEDAQVRSLLLENALVSGNNYVGSVAGRALGSLADIETSGSVTGNNRVGGLVGSSEFSIDSVKSTVEVEASGEMVGGLVGLNHGEISNAKSMGSVGGGPTEVGGLIGVNSGTISQSVATGDVEGNSEVGGLIGSNDSHVTTSYATGAVTGTTNVGGLIGRHQNAGELTQSYSTGAVQFLDDQSGDSIGGLIGYAVETAITDQSYWVVESSGFSTSAAGTPLDEVDMLRDPDRFGSQWTFYPEADAQWVIYPDDQGVIRPHLIGEIPCSTNEQCSTGICDQQIGLCVRCDPQATPFGGGDGSQDSPWRICAEGHLNSARDSGYRQDHMTLYGHLDMTGPWLAGDTIGTQQNPPVTGFNGVFDGDGYAIRNLEISSDGDGIGVFGSIGPDGEVLNLRMENVYVEGFRAVGVAVGELQGTLSGCSITGEAVANRTVGGAVGYLNGGTLQGCHAHVDVTSSNTGGSEAGTGGLVGLADGGLIEDSLATGDVSSQGLYTGGFVGVVSGVATINRSGATGDVTAHSELGGFAGSIGSDVEVNSCFAAGHLHATSDDSFSPGGSAGGFTGGLVGTVRNSYATGTITAANPYRIGGFAGITNGPSLIEDSYAAVSVPLGEGDAVGTFIGSVLGDIHNSFWDTTTGGSGPSYGYRPFNPTIELVGLPTTDFDNNGGDFDDWDFLEIWTIGEAPDGETRPIFQWQQ